MIPIADVWEETAAAALDATIPMTMIVLPLQLAPIFPAKTQIPLCLALAARLLPALPIPGAVSEITMSMPINPPAKRERALCLFRLQSALTAALFLAEEIATTRELLGTIPILALFAI